MPGIFFTFITMRKIRLTRVSGKDFEGTESGLINVSSFEGTVVNYPIEVGKPVFLIVNDFRYLITTKVIEVIDWFEFKTVNCTYKFEIINEEQKPVEPITKPNMFPLTVSLMGFEVIFQHLGYLNEIPNGERVETDKIVCEIRPVRLNSSTRIQCGIAVRDTRDSFDAKKGMSMAFRNATLNGPLSLGKYKAFRTKIYKIIQEA